ncbi:MAG: BtaA family protein [Leptospirales bacterium]|nr:BtaA family protein [Leptospirales bacterium]
MARLVYNQVWEDFAVDLHALRPKDGERALVIASGGCQALNLLLSPVASVLAVDHNEAQTRLLDNKMQFVASGDYQGLWEHYGIPAQRRAGSVYRRGAYGRFPVIRAYLRAVCGPAALQALAEAANGAERRQVLLRRVEPALWNGFSRILPTAAALLCGLHWRQALGAARHGQFWLRRACAGRLRRILGRFALRENYYWNQLIDGAYASEAHAPPYLQARNFSRLQSRLSQVQNVHGSLHAVLALQPSASVDLFNLLDLPEFLDNAGRRELLTELVRVARPGARLLTRSFAPRGVLPTHEALSYQRSLSSRLSRCERTASYARVHLYHVDSTI